MLKVPIKYQQGRSGNDSTEIKCPLGDTTVKEKLFVYEDGNDEQFLKLKKNFLNLVSTYQLWNEATNPGIFVYANFRRCLQGAGRDTWDDCVTEVDSISNGERSEDAFTVALELFTEKVLGEDALLNQKEYLKTTPKPTNMNVKDWVNRVKNINSYMGLMENDATNFTEKELVSEIITKNLPSQWRTHFKLQGLHKASNINDIMTKLQIIESEIPCTTGPKKTDTDPQTTPKTDGKGDGKGKSDNMCKLPGHKGHTWVDCYNNKNGSNFKGTALTLKDFDKDGKLIKKDGDGKKEHHMIEETICSLCYDYDTDEEFNNLESPSPTPEQPTKSSELLISLPTHAGSKKYKTYLCLIDSGTSSSLISKDIIADFPLATNAATEWKTQAGVFKTNGLVRIAKLCLPQFTIKRKIDASFHTFTKKPSDSYYAILGREFMQQIGLDIMNSTQSFSWDGINVPMVVRGYWNPATISTFWKQELPNLRANTPNQLIPEAPTASSNANATVPEASPVMQPVAAPTAPTVAPVETQEEYAALIDLKPAVYKAADIDEIVSNQEHLVADQKELLRSTLRKHISALQGLRGKWRGDKVHLELLPRAKPYHGKAYKIPQAYKNLVKQEIDRLVSIGLLEPVEAAEWSAPSFCIPKSNGSIRFITDFRGLNRWLKRKPYPIPVISDLMQSLSNFKYATTIDLNMGYYSMELDEFSKQLCVIVLPWGLYRYTALPMGIKPASDIFQQAMGTLFKDKPNIGVYLDDIIIFGFTSFAEHMNDVDEALARLSHQGLQINSSKCVWAQSQVDYLGFLVTQDGIQPQPKKIAAITSLKPPRSQKEIRAFIGLVNFYKTFWPKRAELMAPLSKLCGKGIKFKWTDTEQQAFDAIKDHIAEDVLLAFPKYGESFDIYTDCSDTAMSAGIKQGSQWLAFFSKKLTETQQKYPITDRELLAIVETLKHFKYMLLGQPIVIYTDHQNLTFVDTVHTSDRVLRQRLVLEEYGAEIKFIPGHKNHLADALSRLPFEPTPTNSDEIYMIRRASEMAEDFPLSLQLIAAHQKDDEHLVNDIKKPHPKYVLDKGSVELYTTNDHKVYVPETLRDNLLSWYHEMLHHPGETRMSATIKQHFYWPGIDAAISHHVKTCDTCQTSKVTAPKKYGKVPLPTDTTADPWTHVHVDMIGPWSVRFEQANRITTEEVRALTIMDKATGFVEFIPTISFLSKHVAELFDTHWLCRYPRPLDCTFDNGGEFVGHEFQELLASYGIKPNPTTVKNPQGNSVIERVHLTMGDMLRTMTLAGTDWFYELNRTLQSVAWAVRTTVSTTTGYSPGQLAFSRDMIMATQVKIDWERIKAIKQSAAIKNNASENSSRIHHNYQVGDQVLIVLDAHERRSQSKLQSPTRGPYVITKVYNNGTVKIIRGSYEEIIHIRRLKPFHPKN